MELFMDWKLQTVLLLHDFIQQYLNSGFAQVEILLVACRGRRFVMVRTYDRGPSWW